MLIYIKPDSVSRHLFYIISTCGEFPFYSLELLGNEREYKSRVRLMTEENTYQNDATGERFKCKALSVSGKGRLKKIRLTKEGRPLLRWIGTYDYYLKHFCSKAVQNDALRIDRAHRIAETNAMMYSAGIPYAFNEMPGFERSKEIMMLPVGAMKTEWHSEKNVLCFSRATGCVHLPFGYCPVYNCRWSKMKLNGDGELKTKAKVENETAQLKTRAILLGHSYEAGLRTLEQNNIRDKDLRILNIYRNIYFLPLDANGIKMLRIMKLPNYREIILSLIFNSSTRSFDRGSFVYDAYISDRYYFSFLDSDLSMLLIYLRAMKDRPSGGIVCYEFQKEFIRAQIIENGLADKVRIKEVIIDAFIEQIEQRYNIKL